MRYIWLIFLMASPAFAEDDREAFVEANALAIFYHEFGHALIDVLELPVFGQEEDAADVASILMIHAFYDEESAMDLAYGAALGFLAEDQASEGTAYWDVHGPDAQRFYNTVCLFYGAYPDERAAFAEDFELPEERALTCPEEFDLAEESWGPVFDDISGEGQSIVFKESGAATLSAEVIRAEVAALNAEFSLPDSVTVSVEECGEANAFYDPQDLRITFCTEFDDHLREIYDLVD